MYAYRRLLTVFALIVALLGASYSLQAQSSPQTATGEPVVYAVFFYLPTCGHCHEVMNNHLPGIQARFGDQLRVALVNASTPEGSRAMNSAISELGIPSRGVPLMVVGSQYLMGSINIPRDLPGIVSHGLRSGGIGYPAFSGSGALIEAALGIEPLDERANVWSDPANVLAVVVLIGLVGSLALVGVALMQTDKRLLARIHREFGWALAGVGIGLGAVLAASLLLGSAGDTLTLTLSVMVLGVFGAVGYPIISRRTLAQLPGWTMPAVLIAGLLVAGYLAYIETTLSDATCGLVGNCNAVQQSDYAKILGVPVGVLGVIGYLGLLALRVGGRYANLQNASRLILLAVAVGVVFSAYLTFLEPFVIGASCAWCLTSAVIMTLLLWLNLPAAPPERVTVRGRHQRRR